jgi:hypothetical protein
MEEGFIATSNHGLFQVLGLKLASLVLEDRGEAERVSAYAERKFQDIFDAQFDDQGVHREHSPAYHFFAEKIISSIGRHFVSERPRLILPKAEKVKTWLRFPDGSMVRVGDSAAGKNRQETQPPEGPAVALDDGREFLLGDLTKSGYAVVRSPEREGRSMLFVTAAANSLTHKHADDLGFELYEFGRPVIVDSGKYGYFSDKNRRYFKSAAAHNTVSLDGEPITPRTSAVASSLDGAVADGRHFRIWGTVKRENLFEHARTFLYDPGRYLIVLDHVRSGKPKPLSMTMRPANFVSSLHLAPDAEVEVDGRALTVRFADANTLLIDEISGAELDTARGREEPMLGWYSPGYGQAEPTTTIRATGQARKRSFGWVVTLAEGRRDEALAIARAELARSQAAGKTNAG